MFRIHVERVIKKDIDTVFAELADHASYMRFKGITRAELLEEGSPDKNGKGALRLLGNDKAKFVERITCYNPPHRLDYHVEDSTIPIRQEKGQIHLSAESTPEGEHTRVVWISQGHVTIPVVGHLMDKLIQKNGSRAFAGFLKAIDKG